MALKKGNHGDPLSNTIVMRVCTPKNMDADQGKAHPGAFEFTTKDREQTPPQLSVFANDLTTTQEAVNFVVPNGDASLVYLETEQIKKIPIPTPLPPLNIIWDDMTEDTPQGRQLCKKPGANGHCGIINADINGVADSKKIRKRIREDLASISSTYPQMKYFGLNLGEFFFFVKVSDYFKKIRR